jgi:hypothetical protein
LENDLGFKGVIDIDEERLKEGLALKEDLRIGNNVFIKVKGAEKGAKQGWGDELAKHVNQYCKLTKANIADIKQILVFNRERRKDPRERTEPFKGDPEFLNACKVDEIALIPVFELYKLIKKVKSKEITIEKAKEKILRCNGLFHEQ